MGASGGGVSIKIETAKYDLKEIINDLIGTDFIQTENYEDTRNPDNYFIVKTKDVITIYNSQFVETFFKRQDTKEIQSFIDYFEKPELIFAHERYDSGGTYSYSLIYNGELKRQFRSLSYETKIDFGDLEEIEKEWKNGEIKKFDLGGGDFEIIIKNSVTGIECDEGNIPQVILDQLQFDKLGFDDDSSKIIEKAFYIKNPRIENVVSKKTVGTLIESNLNTTINETRPWWKFW